MEQILNFILKKEIVGSVITLIISLLILKIFNILINKIALKSKNEFERKKKKTIIELFKNFVRYAIIVIALITILDMNGVNVSSIVASLGVFSAVIALALQDVLKDVISGCIIIMDNYYIVGDIITYNDFTGTVIQLGLRTTKIMNADRKVMTISNRNVGSIINLSQKNSSMLVEAPTAYEADTAKVEKIINEIVDEVKTWPGIDADKTSYIGITELADSCVKYGIRFYCNINDAFQYQRDLLRLIKIKYDKNNIKIPYNQIEVHNGND